MATALGVLLAGCGGDPGPPGTESRSTSPASTSSPASGESERALRLPTGKSDLALRAGRYESPWDFEPALMITVDDSWTSLHRASDGFDLGHVGDDGLWIALALLAPSESSAEAALETVRLRATGSVTPVLSAIGGIDAVGLDVEDGAGELVVSAHRGIALNAAPGQRLRVLAADVGGQPLLLVVIVPDGARWDEAWTRVEPLVRGIQFR